MWRLGEDNGLLDYAPHKVLRWRHRFDDPEKQYRTLYCAIERITCFREVLGDLRPNTKAIADFQAIFDTTTGSILPAGVVTWTWREQNVLARGSVELHGPLVDLNDVVVRQELEVEHAALLAKYGMEHLYISEVRSTQRPVTQRIGRSLYEKGSAGVLYGSNRDNAPCVALFEGAARLHPDSPREAMTEAVPELLRVCDEYNLVLRGPPA